MKINRLAAVAATLAVIATPAAAHPGVGTHDVLHGFLHPLTGLDHMAAMLAVGVLAARMGGRSLWAVPFAFMSATLLGGLLAYAGVTLPFVEGMVLLSVVALGAAVAFHAHLSTSVAMVLAAGFAVFHGQAHAAELPLASALAALAATGLLHAAGMALVVAGNRLRMAKAK